MLRVKYLEKCQNCPPVFLVFFINSRARGEFYLNWLLSCAAKLEKGAWHTPHPLPYHESVIEVWLMESEEYPSFTDNNLSSQYQWRHHPITRGFFPGNRPNFSMHILISLYKLFYSVPHLSIYHPGSLHTHCLHSLYNDYCCNFHT